VNYIFGNANALCGGDCAYLLGLLAFQWNDLFWLVLMTNLLTEKLGHYGCTDMNPIIFLLIDMLNFLEDIFFIWFVTYCALLVGNVLVCGPCCTYQFSILIYDIYALLDWKLIELVCSIWWNFIKVEGLMRILDSPSENLSKFEIVLISLLQHFVNVFVFWWSF